VQLDEVREEIFKGLDWSLKLRTVAAQLPSTLRCSGEFICKAGTVICACGGGAGVTSAVRGVVLFDDVSCCFIYSMICRMMWSTQIMWCFDTEYAVFLLGLSFALYCT